jgi:hypothetical protein
MEALLAEVGLGAHAELNPRALPGEAFQPELLAGGFYVDVGRISPDSRYQGSFRFRTRSGGRIQLEGTLASVLKIELGEVSELSLKLLPFGGDIVTLPVTPIGDRLEVWVRYFCDLRRPDPRRNVPRAGEPDDDFVLAYLLRKAPENLRPVRDRLPIPEVQGSWQGGGPIGGDPRRCMGPEETALSFDSPFPS